VSVFLDEPPPPPPEERQRPRRLSAGRDLGERIFDVGSTAVGFGTFALIAAIAIFLGYQLIPTLHHFGWSFFTTRQWNPELDKLGIASVLVGSVEVAFVAMAVAFPLAVLFALFITEYAPRWLRPLLVSAIDLMAAVPSIIYGLWGFFLLQTRAILLARWLSQHFGWFPLFHVDTDPNAAVWQQSRYTSSTFIAGLAVSMMAIPLACSVMRSVFEQAPLGEREAAMALGSTRWGVVRTVVLPFGKGAIVGGTMLALGRALGETAAVLIIVSPTYDISLHIFQTGSQTVSYVIANFFASVSKGQQYPLLAAGFVLFVITLAVNSIAAGIVSRSRSGAGTDA
jgi:phosphate transport system permease protein